MNKRVKDFRETVSVEALRAKLYAYSPWDLGSVNDNKFRDAIDSVLDTLA